jgi:uncharacterized iron-regulated membrane protein
MPEPQKNQSRLSLRIKNAFHQIHIWLGITFGIYFAFMGVTGSLYLFHSELDVLFNSSLMRVSAPPGPSKTLSLDRLQDIATNASPGANISAVDPPPSSNRSIDFHIVTSNGDLRELFINPYTGKVLGSRVEGGPFFPKVRQLHIQLVPGNFGEILVKLLPIAATIILLTGVWIWWPPKAKFWEQAKLRSTIKLGAPYKRTIHDMHNAFGIWTVLFLLIASITGAGIAWEDQTVKAAKLIDAKFPGTAVPSTFKAPDTSSESSSNASLDEVAAHAQSVAPGLAIDEIKLNGDSYVVSLTEPNQPEVKAKLVNAYVDLAGTVTDLRRPENQPIGSRAARWVTSAHVGKWGPGPFYYVVMLLVGLSSFSTLILLTTGILKLIGKRKGKAKRVIAS